MQLKEKYAGISDDQSRECCVFEYIYRDASNYTVRGRILLAGILSQVEIEILQTYLESGEYFVAEQVGIPALYKDLWVLSGGPSCDDHSLHEFVALREATDDEKSSLPLFGDLSNLLNAFRSVTNWDYSRSPNFGID